MLDKKASNSSVKVKQQKSSSNPKNTLEQASPVKLPGEEDNNLDATIISEEQPVSELERLRDILFGSQARSTNQQLTNLRAEINITQHNLTDEINKKFDTLAKTSHNETQTVHNKLSTSISALATSHTSNLHAAKMELNQRIDEQSALQLQQLKTVQQELSGQIEKLATDIFSQLQETLKAFNERVDNLEASQSEQLLNLKLETEQRDDAYREEFIDLTKSLDHRKTSRQELSQILAELGQRLYTDKDS